MRRADATPGSAPRARLLALVALTATGCGSCGGPPDDPGPQPEAVAPSDAPAATGVVLEASGEVRVRRPGVERWQRLYRGEAIRPGDAVQTMAGAQATVRFPGVRATTELGPSAIVVVPENTPDLVRVEHSWGHLVARLEPGEGGRLALDLPPGELLLERTDGGAGEAAEARVAVADERTEVAVTRGRGTLRRRGGLPPRVLARGTYGVFDDEGTVLELGKDGPRPTPVSPAEGEHVRVASAVRFLWSDVPEATGYRLEIWTSSATAPTVVETVEPKAGVPLESGPYRYALRAIVDGEAGPSSSPQGFDVEVDRTPPHLELRSPREGEAVLTSAVTVSGMVEPGSTVEIDQAPVPVDADGRFELTRPLRRGLTHLVVRATDDVGNARTVTRSVLHP